MKQYYVSKSGNKFFFVDIESLMVVSQYTVLVSKQIIVIIVSASLVSSDYLETSLVKRSFVIQLQVLFYFSCVNKDSGQLLQ